MDSRRAYVFNDISYTYLDYRKLSCRCLSNKAKSRNIMKIRKSAKYAQKQRFSVKIRTKNGRKSALRSSNSHYIQSITHPSSPPMHHNRTWTPSYTLSPPCAPEAHMHSLATPPSFSFAPYPKPHSLLSSHHTHMPPNDKTRCFVPISSPRTPDNHICTALKPSLPSYAPQPHRHSFVTCSPCRNPITKGPLPRTSVLCPMPHNCICTPSYPAPPCTPHNRIHTPSYHSHPSNTT